MIGRGQVVELEGEGVLYCRLFGLDDGRVSSWNSERHSR